MPVFTRETTFVTTRFLSCTPIPFTKVVFSKRKKKIFPPENGLLWKGRICSPWTISDGRQEKFCGCLPWKCTHSSVKIIGIIIACHFSTFYPSFPSHYLYQKCICSYLNEPGFITQFHSTVGSMSDCRSRSCTFQSQLGLLTLVLLNKFKMPHPLLIFNQSDYLIWIVVIKSHIWWQTVQIQISWLLKKPTDLDLHCLQRQGISGFSRTRVNICWN